MKLSVTSTGRYAIQRCVDALSDIQLTLLSLADGSRSSETLLNDCKSNDVEIARQALEDLIELRLIAPYAPASIQPGNRPKPKRSAAAAKMYLVAIFERFNRPRARSIRQALYSARNVYDLLEVISDAIPFLEVQSSSGYAGNVVNELRQMLPEEYTETLERLLAQSQRELKTHFSSGITLTV
jgi:hypothetical protein